MGKYYIVKFKKPEKHLKGAVNQDIAKKGAYSNLLETEKLFLKICVESWNNHSKDNYRIDDAVHNTQREFYNSDASFIYVKTPSKNEYDKFMYAKYSFEQYLKRIKDQEHNPFTAII
jgi:hypothetical protein